MLPGKESVRGGRRYFEQDSETTKIANLLDADFSFFSFLFTDPSRFN